MATVKVPQIDGEILLALAGDPARVYAVADNKAEVAEAELEDFLAHVDGAVVLSLSPDASQALNDAATAAEKEIADRKQAEIDAAAAAEQNAQAVADATAAGAARAAAELKKGKQAPAPTE